MMLSPAGNLRVNKEREEVMGFRPRLKINTKETFDGSDRRNY
jgi:hypothetical protein